MEPSELSVRVDVSELKRRLGAQESFTFLVEVPSIGEGPERIDFGPAKVDVKLTNAGDSIMATGSIMSEAQLRCSRCMETLVAPLKSRFRVEFKNQLSHAPQDEAGDDEVVIYKDDEIDLGEIIRDTLILAIPMKPVCRPDCKGLCPVCGQNLNVGECDCRQDDVDFRLASLADFFNKKE